MAGHPRRRPGAYGTELAAVLRECIGRKGILQKDIAKKSAISTSQLSLYLRADKAPTVDEFIDICHAMDENPGDLLLKALITVDWRRDNPGAGPTERPCFAELTRRFVSFSQAFRA